MFIIHLGFSGFPKGNASVQRVRLTFKGLKDAGMMPLVINKISHHPKCSEKRINRFDEIFYLNTGYLIYKPDSFMVRNFNKVSGYLGELLFFIRKRKKISIAILYSNYFLELPYYWLLSKIFGFKIVLQYVEFFSAIPGRNSMFTKLNDQLLDQQFHHFCNGIIAISDFLVHHVQKKCPQIPCIKLPAVCDFSEFEKISVYQNKDQQPYLMYCGTIFYLEVIELILSIFEKLKINKKYNGGLILVISGSHADNWERLHLKMKNLDCQKDVLIKSNIPYPDLLSLYKGADILLIPLRDSVQDNARFPHKIGEYTASKRPILSTNTGELKEYFVDGVSALLTNEYSEKAYLEKLTAAIASKAILDDIGDKGNRIGSENFNYLNQGIALKKFLMKL
jgi:glycosyltransferase involved in cell wall biosynthesis